MAHGRPRRPRVPPRRLDRRRCSAPTRVAEVDDVARLFRQVQRVLQARRRRSCSRTRTRSRCASAPAGAVAALVLRPGPDRRRPTPTAARRQRIHVRDVSERVHRARPGRASGSTRILEPRPARRPARSVPDDHRVARPQGRRLSSRRRRSVALRARCRARRGPRVEARVGVGLARSGPRRGATSSRKSSASPTTRPGRHAEVRPSPGGRRAAAGSRRAPPARAAPRSAPRARPCAAASAAAAVLVAGGAVAALEVVELVEQVAGVAHVPAHRLVGPAHRVGVDAQVEVHELRRRRRRRRSGTSARAAAPRSCARRRPRGGGSSRRRPRTSASSACRRRGTARRAARISSGRVLRTTAIVCASTSLWVWIGSCSSRIALSSGRNSSERPVSARNHRPGARVVDQQQLRQLVADALRAHDLEPVAQLDRPRRRARASGSSPNCATKRAARSMRSGSSTNDTSGASGVRSRRAARSAAPPNGSTSSGSGRRDRHRVDGEVAPREVGLDVVGERDLGLAALRPVDLGAERGDLDPDAVLLAADGAEALPLEPHVVGPRPHEPLDDVGAGVGGDVDVGASSRVRGRGTRRARCRRRGSTRDRRRRARRASCCTGDAGSSSGRRRGGNADIAPFSSAPAPPGAKLAPVPIAVPVTGARSDTLPAVTAPCSGSIAVSRRPRVFGFDAAERLVWLDPFDDARARRRACSATRTPTAHAAPRMDTARPPRRRSRGCGPAAWRRRAPRRTRAVRRDADPAALHDAAPAPSLRPARAGPTRPPARARMPAVRRSTGPGTTPGRRTTVRADFEHVLDARTPLLARARSRPRDTREG